MHDINTRSGLTLVETLMVIGIFGLLLATGLPVGIDSYRSYILTAETRNLVSLIRRTQSYSLANTHEANHGIRIETSEYILFEGNSYATRNVSRDELYPRSAAISVTSTFALPEIVFTAISGIPSASGTIILDNSVNTQSIGMNNAGTLFW